MSAYEVSTDCIDRIVPLFMPESFAAEDGDKIGLELRRMNARAVAVRYGDTNVMTDITYRYRSREASTTKMQRYKSLQCFLYQCLEGEVPHCDLFKRGEDAIHRLAREIVSSLPEYDRATWG